MQLLEEERFALTFTLSESSINLDALLINADVTERNRTGVGFFTTVMLQCSIPVQDNKSTYWERNFEHKNMPYGGCFMVRLISSNVLEIEAVAFESHWPEQFRREDFIY
ncbi:hypothetical protein RJ492_004568 [Pluralibacter gergoviae]|uniref:Uncharacterized protein n=1 Tax=Pluralibacter gergoviae TaxID=61647 RepID=A0AAI9GPN4_PLUGE|nr:hypothetical protein [Pluralibacter gergoviae]EKV0918652.1 hypothetical protein [Pluralibacter gergoviae]EKV9909505.1 hypothetical protein [Pluralibacter gergoviae]EKW7277400.1 hypothetical protein [Pluralibacter gergoviae]ELD4297865.1 hypothetical protein [Pluralibacter gergoviae]ELD4308610.1 hypothetical protein [Pluralibacter gergoviae]